MASSADGEAVGGKDGSEKALPLSGIRVHGTGLDKQERTRVYAQVQGLGAEVLSNVTNESEWPDVLVAGTIISPKYRVRKRVQQFCSRAT